MVMNRAAVSSLTSLAAIVALSSCGGGGTATHAPQPAHLSVVAAVSQADAGAGFGVTVKAVDSAGTVVTTFSGTVHFTSSDPQAVLPGDAPLGGGSGTFLVTLRTAGNQSITASDTSGSIGSGTSGAIAVATSKVNRLAVSPASGATTGTAFKVTVTAQDASGNTVTTYGGTVHFTASDPQAALPADSKLTGGTGSFPVTLKAPGVQTITATDTQTATITGTATLNVAAPLAITSGNPPAGVVGTNYGPGTTEFLKCIFIAIPSPQLVCSSVCTFSVSPSVGGCPLTPCRGVLFLPCYQMKIFFNGFTLKATGGIPPYLWSGSGLPSGLRVDATSGHIVGKPGKAGTYNVRIQVNDAVSSPTATANYVIQISNPPPPVVVATAALPIGTVNSPYIRYSFAASGGLPPLTFSASGVPANMSVSAAGVLSGTPATAGTFAISVTATDAANQPSPAQAFSLEVLATGFVPTGTMTTPRTGHTATLLNIGKVLVAGGASATGVLASAELFDPGTQTFSATGNMASARTAHTATLLQNNKVLMTGGGDSSENVVATAEIFDPASGTFTATGAMASARTAHTATLLQNNKVLITGGTDLSGNVLATAEIFDPTSGTFSTTGTMTTGRALHTATLLASGKVLVTGGSTNAAAELYDPATGTFSATGAMSSARTAHSASLLSDGTVLIAGGYDASGTALATAEVFNPTTGTFALTQPMAGQRYLHTAVVLSSGKVLLAGGLQNTGTELSAAETFDLSTGRFTAAADMTAVRFSHTATVLANGQVLVTGGQGGAPGSLGILATAELYQ